MNRLSRNLIMGASLGGIALLVLCSLGMWMFFDGSRFDGRIAYGTHNGNIFVITGNTLFNEHLTQGQDPSLSFNGTLITFSDWVSGDLATIAYDGINRRQIVSSSTVPGWKKDPARSPDNKYIAFSGSSGLYIVDTNNGSAIRFFEFAQPAHVQNPAWSPDSQHVAFAVTTKFRIGECNCITSPWDIYIADIESGSIVQLTTDSTYSEQNPSWSLDGTQIAFASDQSGDFEIYVMDSNGEKPQRLTYQSGTDDMPQWTPDGPRIAFLSGRENKQIYAMDNVFEKLSLYVMKTDGTEQRLMLSRRGLSITAFSWSKAD